MVEIKIKKGTFKHVESELYHFHETRKEVLRLKNHILHASPAPDLNGGGRGNLPGDPTGRTATLLVTHRKVAHLEETLDAIESVYQALTKDKRELIRLRYWTKPQLLTWDGVADKLHISKRQAQRWRDEIVFAIADLLGWR